MAGADQFTAPSISTVNTDTIRTLDGDDSITTGNGSDIVSGGNDADVIVANDGNNILNGGEFAADDSGDGNDTTTGSIDLPDVVAEVQRMADGGFDTSARNRLCGTVRRIARGTVSVEVVLELDGGKTLAAMVTDDSVRALGLEEGMRAGVLVKASHVILGVN